MAVWNQGGQASLNLSTNSGFLDISFNLGLGQPGAPFCNSPSSTPPSRQRHRGPAQKERNRQRAARHQAAQSGEAPVTTASVETFPPVVISPPVVIAQPATTVPVTTFPPETVPNEIVTAPVTVSVSSIPPSVPSVAPSEDPSQQFQCNHCDFVNYESAVRNHMKIFHKPIQCRYCNFEHVSSESIKEHILSSHKSVPSPHVTHSLSKLPLQKKDFYYAHPPYDPKFAKCLLRGEGCIHIANKYFSTVKIVINHQPKVHKHIYTCNSCIKFITPEDQAGSPHLPVGNVI